MSSNKHAARRGKQAGKHRKRAAGNGSRAARNGILAAAVGLGLAVGVGNGIAAATTDGGSSDSNSSAQSAGNSGSNSSHSATSHRVAGKAGPARRSTTGKPSVPASNSGSVVVVRTPGAGRTVPAAATTAEVIDEPETSTETATSTGDTTTPAAPVTPAPPPTPTVRKTATAKSAYSMDGNVAAVQAGAGPLTTPAHYAVQTSLDAWGVNLNAFLAGAPSAANAWLKVPVMVLNTFFTSTVVATTFAYGLNAVGTLLNEFVPPFKMVDGAPSTITQASVTAAVLAGAIKVFNILQYPSYTAWGNAVLSLAEGMVALGNGDLIGAMQDPIISAAAGAFLSPKTVLDMTVDVGPVPNMLSLPMYVFVVAIFRRFEAVAIDHQPVVTDMRQTSQHLPNGSGTTVSGYVQFYDADGDPITSFGFTEPNDSRFTVTVVDGTNGRMNWTVWDWNPLSSDKSPKTLTFTMTVLAQGDGQISVSRPYMPNGNETKKTVTVTVYYNQAIGSMTNTVASTSPMGVVRGTVSAPPNPDNPWTYSLSGASGGSAYTANGGIIKLNAATGAYTYVPNRASGATTDTFQLVSTDSFGNTYTTAVTVPVSSASPVTTTNGTPGTVTGGLNNGSDTGLLTYSIGTQPNPLRGTVTLSANGTFVYTRTAAGHTQPTQDSFTILGTDSSGKTTVVAVVNVNPNVANSAPVGNGVATDSPVGAPTYNPLGGPRDEQHTTGQLKATDNDGDTLTWTAGTYSTANGGTIVVDANGRFTYDKNVFAPFGIHDSYWHHAAGAVDTFTITVSDGFGGSTAVTYGIPIASINAAPTVNSTTINNKTTSGLGVVRGNIAGSDSDGDGLTYRMISATGGSVYSTNGAIVKINSDGSFTYIPKVGVTSDSFQVQVDDGHGGVTNATVNLTGLTTPSPQTNNNTSVGVTTGSLNVPGGDAGLGLTFSQGSAPSKGSVVVNANGTYTYTRTAGLGHSTSPNDSFTIVATDASGKSVVIATINVAPSVSNTAPAVTVNGGTGTVNVTSPGSLNKTTYVQTITGITFAATDSDGDALSVNNKYDGTGTNFALAGGGTISTANGGTVTVNANGSMSYSITKNATYYHEAAKIGASGNTVADWFNLTVSDAYGGTTTVRVNLPVFAVNSAPTFASGDYVTGLSGTKVVWNLNVDDADGDLVGTTRGGTPGYDNSKGGNITGNLDVGGASYGFGSGTLTITVRDGYYLTNANGTIAVDGSGNKIVASTSKSWS